MRQKSNGLRTNGASSAAEPVVKTRSVLFTDVVGSTRILDEHGDERWFRIIAWHHEQADRLASMLGGERVTSTGDGVVAVFDNAPAALCFGLEMMRFMQSGLGPTSGLDLRLRAGLATGPVHAWHTSYYGRTMHVGSRLTSSASPGELFIDEESARALPMPNAEMKPQGTLCLRGFSTPQRVYSLTTQQAARDLRNLGHPALATA